MRQYELYPPHLITVATLPCEIQNAENVTLQRNITKGNCIRYDSFIKVDHGHHVPEIYLYGSRVLYSKACMKQKIHDIYDLQQRLMQTCFDFDRNIINAGVTI